ncbi:MAG: hypothetical protein ABFS46_22785 [Myxococcota bacterium]
MLGALLGLAVLLSAADHWTTWLCLSGEFPGFVAVETNPLAAWLFGHLGLGAGLMIDSLVTFAALSLLVLTERLPKHAKLALLAAVVLVTARALAANLRALSTLGLSPLGVA